MHPRAQHSLLRSTACAEELAHDPFPLSITHTGQEGWLLTADYLEVDGEVEDRRLVENLAIFNEHDGPEL